MQKNIKKVASFLIDNLHTVNLMKNNKKLFYESNSTTYILQPVVSIAQLINWKKWYWEFAWQAVRSLFIKMNLIYRYA